MPQVAPPGAATSKVICDNTYSDRSWSIICRPRLALQEVNQMERKMRSYLQWRLNIEPSTLKEFDLMIREDSKGLGCHLAQYTLLTPSSGTFMHSKPGTNRIPTATPSCGPAAPLFQPSAASPIPSAKSSRRSSVESYPTPPSSHLNAPSQANSRVSPATPSNYKSDSAKTVSFATSSTIQIP